LQGTTNRIHPAAGNVESWSHNDMRLAAKAMRGMSNAFQTCDLIKIDG
jgi:hypothetical protein